MEGVAREVCADWTHRYRGTPRAVIFGALTVHRQNWIGLHPGEVLPDLLEMIPDQRVVWSSFWPISPDDTVELTLTEDRGDTLVRFQWFTSSPPDERGIGITRQRLNTKLGGDIRGWLASNEAWEPDARSISVDGSTLAESLAERLDGVVPAGVQIFAQGASVSVQDDSGLGLVQDVGGILEQHGDSIDLIVLACLSVLNSVQDFVAETLTVPWPDAEMAMPGVRVADDRILLWYGDESDPALALPPISRFT
jgi:hypothetical protein